MASAYLLISHGSRDPRPQIAVDRLAQELILYLPVNPPALVETGQLELAEKPLHNQIVECASRWIEAGIDTIIILPLFLIPGVHVMDDIPAEVAIAQQILDDRVKLIVAPFLSDYPNFINLFADNRSRFPSSTIILAHGSRRKGGNTIVESLAARLKVDVAYWSIEPSSIERVTALVASGTTEIGILPYFLFAGGIVDAIAELVTKLRQQFPQVKLILGEPIGNSPELVATIGEILLSIAA